ncbi:MAG TPA: RlmE family RNA methyltransferase [Candidatus Lokiarchaeia archaeon]|nr:RlmE family RNA methyltransferase [Candidatus Lokiarchaeia archaeon]
MTPNKRWVHERRHEMYYRKAKADGFSSRAAYKIQQIDEKHDIFAKAGWVLDLCSAPGSWTEYVHGTFPKTKIIGADLLRVKPVSERVVFLKKDILDTDFFDAVCKAANKQPPFLAVVLSDCAQKFTGARSIDLFRQHELSMRAVDCCKQLLLPGGNCVIKSFQGLPEESKELDLAMRETFEQVFKSKPKSSQQVSSEFYYIGKGKK